MNRRGALTPALVGTILVALTFVLGCSTSNTPSFSKAEGSEPVLATPTASPNPTADTGEDKDVDVLDIMDEDTRQLFESMTPEWQKIALEELEFLRTVDPNVDLKDAAQSIVPQIYDDAQTQGGIRIHTAGSDDARWCRVTGPAGQTEAIGDVTVDDVLDADTAFFFNGLSPTGLEVVSLIFEQLEIATPCTKWQRLMRKYVEYLHTAERGEWTQEKPSPRK